MRTNIEIDDDVLDLAMRTGPFKTKKEAVDAGLRLLARQAAYREILRYEGKLKWDEDEAPARATKRTPRRKREPSGRASKP
jgi:antitoxin ParD1/3/4